MLRDEHINRIVEASRKRSEILQYARLVSRAEIEANNFNLSWPRYFDQNASFEAADPEERYSDTRNSDQPTPRAGTSRSDAGVGATREPFESCCSSFAGCTFQTLEQDAAELDLPQVLQHCRLQFLLRRRDPRDVISAESKQSNKISALLGYVAPGCCLDPMKP